MNQNDIAIECENLCRVYKSGSIFGHTEEVPALVDLSLRIRKGGVFGLLGPNGAGKTTAVRILTTLLAPTSGRAEVLSYDVVRQPQQVRERIGLVLGGDTGLFGRLTGKQNLQYFGALSHLNPKECERMADYLLERLGLGGAGKTLVERYSRGMKQRLHVARGLLTDPDVLFMDEPTIGLDPMGAQDVRQLIAELAGDGKTILLTTHYMLEADILCDAAAIINKGRLVVQGSPAEIKGNISQIRIIQLLLTQTRENLTSDLSDIPGVKAVDDSAEGVFQRVTVWVTGDVDIRTRIEETVGRQHIESVIVREPTLEEAYLSILA